MQWMQSEFPLREDDRVVQRTRCSFDASVWEFFAPLLAGACLVVPPPAQQSDTAELVRVIRTQKVTVLQLVPSLLRILLEEPQFADCRSLRRLFCGGEKLTVELRDRFLAMHPATLCNLYGPTEACIDAIYDRCAPMAPRDYVPIGRPISNMKAFVLDPYLNAVPIGVSGELYLSGEGLARGYMNQPGLTAEKFVYHPFTGGAARMYRTGDVVRFRQDGNLEFIGRSDHLVKLRGFRIELGEIECRLSRHVAVKQCAVEVHDDQLTAYLVCHPGSRPAIEELKRFLQEELPDHMVPSAFVFMDVMPVMPNGKLDRRALPDRSKDRPELDTNFSIPATELEQAIAEVWENVLSLNRVGLFDNFFDLGGHSLLLVRLQRELCYALNLDVSVVDLFRYPNIKGIARYLQSKGETSSVVNSAHARAAKQTEARNSSW
jgi:acyl-coenzyme A synthetase/AMP-(fatty) acid ligase